VPLIARLGFALSFATLLAAAAGEPAVAAPLSVERVDPESAKPAKISEVEKEVDREAARARKAERKRGEKLAGKAREYVGHPYRWGGSSPNSGFDCSGFVMYVYGTAGLNMPRDFGAQLESGRSVERDQLAPGDLVVFKNTYKVGLSHAGVYVGDGQFVHAADEAYGVTISAMGASYWATRYAAAARLGTQ
jgi:cell wall-associated NlpC family hydrolase